MIDETDQHEEVPQSIASAEMEIVPGLKVKVHVLDNGQRVIEESDMRRMIEWIESGASPAAGETPND